MADVVLLVPLTLSTFVFSGVVPISVDANSTSSPDGAVAEEVVPWPGAGALLCSPSIALSPSAPSGGEFTACGGNVSELADALLELAL